MCESCWIWLYSSYTFANFQRWKWYCLSSFSTHYIRHTVCYLWQLKIWIPLSNWAVLLVRRPTCCGIFLKAGGDISIYLSPSRDEAPAAPHTTAAQHCSLLWVLQAAVCHQHGPGAGAGGGPQEALLHRQVLGEVRIPQVSFCRISWNLISLYSIIPLCWTNSCSDEQTNQTQVCPPLIRPRLNFSSD